VHTIAVALTVILLAIFLGAFLYGWGHALLFWRLYQPWRDSLHARGLGPRFWSYPITPDQWRRYIEVVVRLHRRRHDTDAQAEMLRAGARGAELRFFAGVLISVAAVGAALAVHALMY
jgi:hypothetical protein